MNNTRTVASGQKPNKMRIMYSVYAITVTFGANSFINA